MYYVYKLVYCNSIFHWIFCHRSGIAGPAVNHMSSLLNKQKREDGLPNFRTTPSEGRRTLLPRHCFQICRASRNLTPKERLKRLNDKVDYVPKRGFQLFMDRNSFPASLSILW